MGGLHQSVSVIHNKIVAVADPHLESAPGDVAHMIRFIETLDPAENALVFLGDLFMVWTASRSFHSSGQRQLMDVLHDFRARGGAAFLTVGNRDLFFKDVVPGTGGNGLPFDVVSREFIDLELPNGRIMAHHGDTVNIDDRPYLRWRRIVRSSLTEKVFSMIPVAQGKKIVSALEKKMKSTNQRNRIYFPEANWSKFVSDLGERHGPNLLLVGHFHPEQPVITRHGETTGIVVPSWQRSRAYLVIDDRLNFQTKQFGPRA